MGPLLIPRTVEHRSMGRLAAARFLCCFIHFITALARFLLITNPDLKPHSYIFTYPPNPSEQTSFGSIIRIPTSLACPRCYFNLWTYRISITNWATFIKICKINYLGRTDPNSLGLLSAHTVRYWHKLHAATRSLLPQLTSQWKRPNLYTLIYIARCSNFIRFVVHVFYNRIQN